MRRNDPATGFRKERVGPDFSSLESRLARIEARLDRLESVSVPVSSEIETPTFEPTAHHSSAEYVIGAKLLPRLGASLIVLAIAFIAIVETSKNPALNKGMLLAIEAVFCLAFVGFGEWKRNELEGFGQTLAAIGSLGLYMTAAGGHFAYGELSAATMATGFAVLTLLNHAYSALRNSRTFFVIGASGGLAAMLFPLAVQDYGTALLTYTVVTVGGAVACAIRRWLQLSIVGWVLGLLILAPVIDSAHPRLPVVFAMYLGSLACIYAAMHSYSKWSLDPWNAGAGISIFLTGFIGWRVLPSADGLLPVLVFAAAGGILSQAAPRDNLAAKSLLVGSAAIGLVLGPLYLPATIQVYVFVALATSAWVLGAFRLKVWAAWFGVSEAAMAALVATFSPGAQGAPGAVLGALALGIAFAALSVRRVSIQWRSLAILGAWGIIARLAGLLTPAASAGQTPVSSLTIGTSLLALFLLLLGFRKHCRQVRLWSFVIMLTSVVQVLTVDAGSSAGFRLGALLLLGLMMLILGYRYVHGNQPDLEDVDAQPA